MLHMEITNDPQLWLGGTERLPKPLVNDPAGTDDGWGRSMPKGHAGLIANGTLRINVKFIPTPMLRIPMIYIGQCFASEAR